MSYTNPRFIYNINNSHKNEEPDSKDPKPKEQLSALCLIRSLWALDPVFWSLNH